MTLPGRTLHLTIVCVGTYFSSGLMIGASSSGGRASRSARLSARDRAHSYLGVVARTTSFCWEAIFR
jgi:hypothetical protein